MKTKTNQNSKKQKSLSSFIFSIMYFLLVEILLSISFPRPSLQLPHPLHASNRTSHIIYIYIYCIGQNVIWSPSPRKKNRSRDLFEQFFEEKYDTPLLSLLLAMGYHNSSSTRMTLALNNPRKLICHETKKPSQFIEFIFSQITIVNQQKLSSTNIDI